MALAGSHRMPTGEIREGCPIRSGKVRINELAGYFFPRLVRPARPAFIQPGRDRLYFYDSSRSAILVNCVPCPWSLALVHFAKKET
jgi:hypothetical protein